MNEYKMNDEINRTVGLFKMDTPLALENGQVLNNPQTIYETYGSVNSDASNVILVCHALTGSSNAAGSAQFPKELIEEVPQLKKISGKYKGYWDDIIGPGKLLDTDKYFIISSNILGSCYGASGSLAKDTNGQKYGNNFPQVTVRDIVRLQKELLDYLNIHKIKTVIGGSLGGMQVLEWALLYPEMVESIVPIATASRHSDWCIGINHLQRQAIMNDPQWSDGKYSQNPRNGLSLARQIAMVSYRTYDSFNNRYKHEKKYPQKTVFDKKNIYQVESYLTYQGEKLLDRFDANSYIYLSYVLDLHDVGRDREGVENALSTIKLKTLCIGIDSDLLYPAREQEDIAAAIPNAIYKEIFSSDGHDAFLIEYDQMSDIIKPFLESI
jgi:homoserine O-acetyltransferase